VIRCPPCSSLQTFYLRIHQDLWGRGYTDSCADLKHDDRLYSSEILIVLASSKLSWIGGPDGGFDLIGYSLGGGIATAFASYFSSMVRSLILLAPSGIIRPEHMNAHSRILYYTGLVPESFMLWLCKKRLLAGPMYAKENKEIDITDAFNAEVQGDGHP
jgi:pimeloyl-ACP methyl ester carboxylesterase